MQKLKGFHIVVRKGQAEEVLHTTDTPFQWFPELRTMFEHFNIKELKFDLDLEKEFHESFKRHCKDVVRVTFQIKEV